LKRSNLAAMPKAASLLNDLQWVKSKVLLDLELYDDADAACNELKSIDAIQEEEINMFRALVKKAREDHAEQEKQLYRKMINSKKDKGEAALIEEVA